jgi:hypothetical protein
VKNSESESQGQTTLKVCSQKEIASLFYPFEFEQNVRNAALLYIQNIQPGDKTKKGFSLCIIH